MLEGIDYEIHVRGDPSVDDGRTGHRLTKGFILSRSFAHSILQEEAWLALEEEEHPDD